MPVMYSKHYQTVSVFYIAYLSEILKFIRALFKYTVIVMHSLEMVKEHGKGIPGADRELTRLSCRHCS